MKITIETIPHASQRYPTAGDWWVDPDGSWQIRVSQLSQRLAPWQDAEFLIALHELIEMALCMHKGVTVERVDKFDKDYMLRTAKLHHALPEEPGDCIEAPYYHQHQIATAVERLMAAELAVDWHEYDTLVNDL